MIKPNHLDFRNVSALIAPGCNLKCSYCEMAKNITGHDHKELWDNTLAALENGDFARNITKTLKRLNQPKNMITLIEFWGQEPTLVFPSLIKGWDTWVEEFPSLGALFFSTNGMTDTDEIFNFFLKVEETAKNPMSIGIQLSYDGDYGEEVIRGGDGKYILENYLKLIDKINNYPFRNITKIEFTTHAVISIGLIRYLNTIEKIESYFDNYEGFLDQLQLKVQSSKIKLNPAVFFGQNCYEGSTQDGIDFDNFLSMLNIVKMRKPYAKTLNAFFNTEMDLAIKILGFGGDAALRVVRETHYDSLDTFINQCIAHPKMTSSYFNSNTCSANIGEFKVLYDGTIVSCQNLVYDAHMKKENLDDSINDWGRYYYTTKGQVLDGINSTDDEVNKWLTITKRTQLDQRTHFTFSSLCDLMYIMAKLGQIKSDYLYNKTKIRRHAFYLTKIFNCPYNNQVLSGSVYLRASGEIRYMCNGVLDRIDKALEVIQRNQNGDENER